MNPRWLPSAVLGLMLTGGPLQAQTFEIIVEGGKSEMKNVPVCVSVTVPGAAPALLRLDSKGRYGPLPGQLTAPGLVNGSRRGGEDPMRRDLHFILPELKVGETVTLTAAPAEFKAGAGFQWHENRDGSTTLDWAGDSGPPRPVMKYMHAPYDNSTPEKRNRTYKVFHHLYDPAGTRYVTNGGHTDPYQDEKKLLYPHHRGLMYAFNRITYDGGKQADTWHAKPGDTHEQHEKVLSQEAGPVLGRHRVLISWRGPKDDVFANEVRELTVYHVPGGTLVEFASRLTTADGNVRLDGDPQHAGFQFRASNEVAEKTAKQTYYVRPDGKGAPGETRNWEPKTRQGPVNLPWDAMSFVLGGQRYTVAYLNHPHNPRESRFSERDYGRFGCYFEYDLVKDHPLVVNYRVWLQDGEMTGEQVQALYDEFAHPPRAAKVAAGSR